MKIAVDDSVDRKNSFQRKMRWEYINNIAVNDLHLGEGTRLSKRSDHNNFLVFFLHFSLTKVIVLSIICRLDPRKTIDASLRHAPSLGYDCESNAFSVFYRLYKDRYS